METLRTKNRDWEVMPAAFQAALAKLLVKRTPTPILNYYHGTDEHGYILPLYELVPSIPPSTK